MRVKHLVSTDHNFLWWCLDHSLFGKSWLEWLDSGLFLPGSGGYWPSVGIRRPLTTIRRWILASLEKCWWKKAVKLTGTFGMANCPCILDILPANRELIAKKYVLEPNSISLLFGVYSSPPPNNLNYILPSSQMPIACLLDCFVFFFKIICFIPSWRIWAYYKLIAGLVQFSWKWK